MCVCVLGALCVCVYLMGINVYDIHAVAGGGGGGGCCGAYPPPSFCIYYAPLEPDTAIHAHKKHTRRRLLL